MTRIALALLFAVLIALPSGCVSYVRVVPVDAQPDESAGYVFGELVNEDPIHCMGLVLRNTSSKKEYRIKFQTKAKNPLMISVEPGRYQLDHFTLANMFAERMGTIPAEELNLPDMMTAPFEVRSGEAVFLGRYGAGGDLSTVGLYYKHTYVVWLQDYDFDVTCKRLRRRYSNFGAIRCVPLAPPTPHLLAKQ